MSANQTLPPLPRTIEEVPLDYDATKAVRPLEEYYDALQKRIDTWVDMVLAHYSAKRYLTSDERNTVVVFEGIKLLRTPPA